MAGFKINERLTELESKGEKFVSFEFFPPKTEDGVKALMARIGRYSKQEPVFMDMTWGAGGSTSELTMELCTQMNQQLNVNSNMHLTCTNMPEEKIDVALKTAKEVGIRNIVALRGDPPAGEEEWKAVDGGYSCALDLVKHIRKEYDDYFCIAVSGRYAIISIRVRWHFRGRRMHVQAILRVIPTPSRRWRMRPL
eukprot:TRINITY_DN8723_c0_g1_i3.p1 TRINITY_DN8723_c0_g1~~TRINITY_DN8723_c0_g1_i3.p1  ORF type:complete len:195 (+),score=44.15 TRINITY_DN8723_c0_g1_i3:94-678(+)